MLTPNAYMSYFGAQVYNSQDVFAIAITQMTILDPKYEWANIDAIIKWQIVLLIKFEHLQQEFVMESKHYLMRSLESKISNTLWMLPSWTLIQQQ
jgi:hypothetical protein